MGDQAEVGDLVAADDSNGTGSTDTTTAHQASGCTLVGGSPDAAWLFALLLLLLARETCVRGAGTGYAQRLMPEMP